MFTTQEKFDIIASDPLDVFIKGTAALYSKEYFETVKRHLNPGGMFTLYVPLYETDEATIKSELATFFEVFPEATVWANLRQGAGYDLVLMGQMEPLVINLDEVLQRFDRPDYAAVRQSLHNVDFNSAFDMLATYLGSAADLKPWVQGAQINTDGNLRLSYLAGWGINSEVADNLYHLMLAYRHLPVTIFSGSTDHLRTFLAELQSPSVAVDDSEDPD